MDGQGGLAEPETQSLIYVGVGGAFVLAIVTTFVCLRNRRRAQLAQQLANSSRREPALCMGGSGTACGESGIFVDVEAGESLPACPTDSDGPSPNSAENRGQKPRQKPRQKSRPRHHHDSEPAQQQHVQQQPSSEQLQPEPQSHYTAASGDGVVGAPPTPAKMRSGDLRAAVESRRAAAAAASASAKSMTTPKHESQGPATAAVRSIDRSGKSGGASSRRTSRPGSFVHGEALTPAAPASSEMPDEMRQRIDAMRRELRQDTREREPNTPSKLRASLSSEELGPPSRSTRPSREEMGAATPGQIRTPTQMRSCRPSREEMRSSREGSRRPSREVADTPATAAPSTLSPRVTPLRRLPSGADASAEPVVTTPRKKEIDPPTIDEQREMEIFMKAETAQRRQREEQAFSPAAKLRELRKEMPAAADGHRTGKGSACTRGETTDRELRAAHEGGSKHDVDGKPERRRSSTSPFGRRFSSSAAKAALAESGNSNASDAGSKGGGSHAGRSRRLSKSFTCHQKAKPASGVAGLKERKQKEEAEQRERASKKAAADRLLGRWGDKHRGDVYEMMRTIHLFTDIFAEDPMANVALTRGDTTALKKAWHKLAAKLHPDRQRAAPTATQVLAEEVFKQLTIAYNKEVERVAKRGDVRA